MLPFNLFFAVPLLITATALPLEQSREERNLKDHRKATPSLADSQHSEGAQEILRGDSNLRGIWNNPAAPEQRNQDQQWRGIGGQITWRHKVLRTREIPPVEDAPEEPINAWSDQSNKAPESDTTEIQETGNERNETPEEQVRASNRGRKSQMPRTSEQKAATSALLRQKKAELTPEQKGAAAEKNRQTRAGWTPEKKEEVAEKMRQAHARQTPEEKAARSKKKSETMRNKSPEQKEATARKRAQTNAQKSAEEKAARIQKMSEGLLNKSPEEKEARKAKMQQAHAQKSPEEKSELSAKLVRAHAERSPEKKAEIGAKISEAQRKVIAAKTPEQREATAEKQRRTKAEKSDEEKAQTQAKKKATMERNKRLREEAAKRQGFGQGSAEYGDKPAKGGALYRGIGVWDPAAGEAWKEHWSRVWGQFLQPFVDASRSATNVKGGLVFPVTTGLRVPIL